MITISSTSPVLVTGANGYMASWLVKLLLKNGYVVHATVRNSNDSTKVQHLLKLATDTGGTLKLFDADLLKPGSYKDAMAGCELVFHTASPFILNVKDAYQDLVRPALEGSRNVLECANNTPSVKRVVLTSSIAAIFGDAADIKKMKKGCATEDDWNFSSSPRHQPYSYSKTVAEREAWKIANQQQQWQLIVVNPALIVGSALGNHVTSESFNIMRQMGDGSFSKGVPEINFSFVDVKDVALAHFRAGILPNSEGRHIIAAQSASLLDIANILRTNYGDKYQLPAKILPKLLVWLAAPSVGIPRRMIMRNVGYPVCIDNSKSKDRLGMKYKDIKESIINMFEQAMSNC